MNAYTPVSTGYDAHAEARHRAQMAQAAVEAVNGIPSDEEMIEDYGNVFGNQCFPKWKVVDTYGKSSGKGQSRNAYGLEINSNPELYRHDPLGRADRSQSPETVITYTYDFKKPIEYHPNTNNTENRDRGDQTPHIVPHGHSSPNIPWQAAASTGSERPHIGDSPPRNDAARDEHFKQKWREVFCQYAATHDKEIIEKTKAACMKVKNNMEEAAAERES